MISANEEIKTTNEEIKATIEGHAPISWRSGTSCPTLPAGLAHVPTKAKLSSHYLGSGTEYLSCLSVPKS